MVEISGQAFEEGDIVHFEIATLPENRTRDYTITAVTPHGIEVRSSDFRYRFTFATATRIGITRATEPQDRSREVPSHPTEL
ncbi:hypothetical protein [Streptomyces clavifer]|uniref:hypothetical protein n=1 Tax=Streptomyces clavifer TaxID=68188 RepID=UPI0036512235